MTLSEIRVKDLGVIRELNLPLGGGLTAVTGETGAGKTLIIEAIGLLVGGRAVGRGGRSRTVESRVDGRFVDGTDVETVLSRSLPIDGRSRAYVDGAPATAAVLATAAGGLVELHGQHDHQSLLTPATQRDALDAFGRIDSGPVAEARKQLRDIASALSKLGGDGRAREREIDLLRHQISEIEAVGILGADEEDSLTDQESRLANATAHREAAAQAHDTVVGDGGVVDRIGFVVAALSDRVPLADLLARARSVAAEADDLARDLLSATESLKDDPDRLEAVQARRRLLADLRRKYGDSLKDVMAFAVESAERLAFLEDAVGQGTRLEAARSEASARLADVQEEMAAARRAVSEPLAAAVESALRELALPRAKVEVSVEGEGGAEVTFMLSANPGEAPMPLTKVASGGELSRAMLALRLTLSDASGSSRKRSSLPGGGPPTPASFGPVSKTLVFDEVDSGIGGEAAVAVGRALARVARRHQVLVVTHLPQVAAFADHQIAVTKVERDGRVSALAHEVRGPERVTELSRMLSGQPGSASAKIHAEELLELAAAERKSGA